MRIISFVPFSAALEPTGRAVSLLCNFVSPRDQTLMERFVVTLGAKFARELTREFVAKIDILNAALLQESASGAALRGSGDFASVR